MKKIIETKHGAFVDQDEHERELAEATEGANLALRLKNSIKATFISEWDGCEDVSTDCRIDTKTGEVFDIESVDVDDEYEHLNREYVELPDGRTFDVEETDGLYFISATDLKSLYLS